MTLTEILTSRTWWISVVVVGIGANLFSTFLYRKLETWSGRFSERARNRASAKVAKREKNVTELMASPSLRAERILQAGVIAVRMFMCVVFLIGLTAVRALMPDRHEWLDYVLVSTYSLLLLIGLASSEYIERQLLDMREAHRRTAASSTPAADKSSVEPLP